MPAPHGGLALLPLALREPAQGAPRGTLPPARRLDRRLHAVQALVVVPQDALVLLDLVPRRPVGGHLPSVFDFLTFFRRKLDVPAANATTVT